MPYHLNQIKQNGRGLIISKPAECQ